MRGKYSPTVQVAYWEDPDWWDKLEDKGPSGDEWIGLDVDGFDSYGYNRLGIDRAGIDENDYALSDSDYEDVNFMYNHTLDIWGFDGVRPVRKTS